MDIPRGTLRIQPHSLTLVATPLRIQFYVLLDQVSTPLEMRPCDFFALLYNTIVQLREE